MKLATKYTIWYLGITTTLLIIASIILYNAILTELEDEAQRRLSAWIEGTVENLSAGKEALNANPYVSITTLPVTDALVPKTVSQSTGIFPPKTRGIDRKLTVQRSYKINGTHYLISASDFIVEKDEIERGIRDSIYIVFLLLITSVSLASYILSKRILAPFYRIIKSINAFNIKKGNAIKKPKTSTREFNELGAFLEQMSAKAISDYQSLKEFSENASHEIQTPLAVIRGKTELLAESDLTEEQSAYVTSIVNAVHELSSLNSALTLLTRLGNMEFVATEKVDLSHVLTKALDDLDELFQMKSLQITQSIGKDVLIPINGVLTEILLNNLLGNAIRHNVEGGRVDVVLTNSHLVISNTGEEFVGDPQDLFRRFKKGNQSSSSTGLGLSIVKEICDLSGIEIKYSYSNLIHTVTLEFQDL